jgi:hypothetical protein
MLIQKKKPIAVGGPTAGEQRTGIDRRVLSYDRYIPERREDADRRLGRRCSGGYHEERRNRPRYG